MSRDAEDWVWTRSRSRGVARLVALAVARYAGPDLTAFAGTTLLMQMTGAGRTAVKTAVDSLIKDGELAIVPGRTGPRGETVYALPLAVGHRAGGSDSDPGQIPTRVGNEPRGGTESDPRGVGNEPRGGTESDPQIEKKRSSRKREKDARERAPLSGIPADWKPSPADLQAAATDIARLGPSGVAAASRKFVAHHRQLKTRRADWGAAWVTWLARERADPRDTPTPTPSSYADVVAAQQQHREEPAPPALRGLSGGGGTAAGGPAIQPPLLAAVPDPGPQEIAALRQAAEQDLALVLAAVHTLGEAEATDLYGGALVARAFAAASRNPHRYPTHGGDDRAAQ